MKDFGIPWKAIGTFLGVFAGQLWARATVTGVPVIPETGSGWLALLGGSAIAAVGVYVTGNRYTLEQANQKVADAENREARRVGRHAAPDPSDS